MASVVISSLVGVPLATARRVRRVTVLVVLLFSSITSLVPPLGAQVDNK